MKWILLIIAIAVIFWLIEPKRRRGAEARRKNLGRRQQVVDPGRLNVPPEIERRITDALGRDEDLDGADFEPPFHGHYQSIVGESFRNEDGSSRGDLIAAATPGTPAFLVPEPSNPHDAGAVRVMVPQDDGTSRVIGYLPRGADDVKDDARNGRAAAWIASKGRKRGHWGAALYVLRSGD